MHCVLRDRIAIAVVAVAAVVVLVFGLGLALVSGLGSRSGCFVHFVSRLVWKLGIEILFRTGFCRKRLF